MKYIHRALEAELLSALKQFPAVAITGPRQSGKSTLLRQILGEKYQYITFDDLSMRERCQRDPKLFLDGLENKVIFDEIQYVPELLSYLKIAIDNDRDKNGRFIVTGSQQFNLIKNLSDTLAGRICLLNLLPLGLQEAELPFIKACLTGSFPELLAKRKLNLNNWYSSYVQTYLERDVRGLYGVGSLLDFQNFMRLLAGRCSQLLSLTILSNDLGVAVSTVKNWLSILVASQLVFLLPPYYKNFGKRVVKSPKVYFTDCGLACYLVGLNTKDLIYYGPLAGALFENYIIQETLKKYYSDGRRPEIYYYRTHKGLEVDLLISLGGKLVPFEIKMAKTPNRGMVNNLDKLREISGEVEANKGGLISLSAQSFQLTRASRSYTIKDFFSAYP